MAQIELIGVPFDGYGRRGHQASAASRLRRVGLAESLAGHHAVDAGDIDLPDPNPTRAPGSGLMNEAALIAMTQALEERVGGVLGSGAFPVVVGGDCSALLGIAAGVRRAIGELGLVFVDGHEDTMPLDVSEDGEGANAELGMLLGLTGQLAPAPLREQVAILDRTKVAVLGTRDADWRRRFNVASLRDWGVWLRALDEVIADPAGSGRDAVAHLRSGGVDRWWLHVDLDVLDPVVFPAQGLPDVPDDPGGLDWEQLVELLTGTVTSGGCVGWSLAIYDPDQDPDLDSARAIVRMVTAVTDAVP